MVDHHRLCLHTHLSKNIVPLRLFYCDQAGINVVICAQL